VWADISVVIPNYNGAGFILESLQAVKKSADQYPGDVHIIVVDDASTDDSVNAIGGRHPDVTVIAKSINGGFAQAVKTGMEAAQTEWVVLLNSDVYPDEGFLQPLMRWAGMADLFAVGCRIERSDGTVEKVSWVRRDLKWGALSTRPWRLEEYNQLLERGQAVATLFASGGSMLVHRGKFLELGGFLPLFEPFYYEDVDLGIRAWRRGWKILAEPASRVLHDSGQTIDRVERASRVDRIRKRNKLFVGWLHVESLPLLSLSLPRLAIKAVGWLTKGRWLEHKSIGDALQQVPAVRVARADNRAQSRYSLNEVLSLVNESPAIVPSVEAANQ